MQRRSDRFVRTGHYLLALLLVLGTSFGLKFIVYDTWIFRRKPNENPP